MMAGSGFEMLMAPVVGFEMLMFWLAFEMLMNGFVFEMLMSEREGV